jgi:hypothetical protein
MKSKEPIDPRCLEQACEGIMLGLRCEIVQWAGHYEVPIEVVSAMVADWFIFERSGIPRTDAFHFAAMANDILSEEEFLEENCHGRVYRRKHED